MGLFDGILKALPGVGDALNIWGSIQGLRRGGNLANQGQQQYNEAVTNARNGYSDALKLYQDNKASGAYDAANALKLLGDQSAHALALTDKNTAGQLATFGYKRGDSPFQQGARHNSEAANLQLRQDMLNTQRAYRQDEQNALNNVESYRQNLNNTLMGVGGQNIARGTQMQQGAMNGIGSIFSALRATQMPMPQGTPGINPNAPSPYSYPSYNVDANGNQVGGMGQDWYKRLMGG